MKQEDLDLTKLLSVASLAVASAEENLDFVQAHLVVDCGCELGEGVIFDDQSHTVLWTDINGKRYHELHLNYLDPTKAQFSTYNVPKKLCSFGMVADSSPPSSDTDTRVGRKLLCAWEDGFQLYDIHNGKALSEYSTGEDVNPDKGPTRLNDGRVDPSGNRFVCGGYYGEIEGQTMKVFKVEQKNVKKLYHEAIVDTIEVTNSINWTLDGKTMYLANSPTRAICTYTYHKNGTVTDRKEFHKKPDGEKGVPDGSCVDSEGYLWNAVWRSGHGPGMVQRINPDTGLVVFTVHMPDATSQVTCCCFGGVDMDILFITSAAEHLDLAKEPHAGGLYAAKVPYKGRKESRFRLTPDG
ncbi:D-glucono-1,5-lactone lactonohydrolase [Phaeodactylum tricornutum CCAP 1055/1]|jgi:L-arabinonolactonase|uniref:D-glucono-1,5-lactone lactonohydrolase n=1 Tax=Phaeodactylum tricornutum (strain CCAP 1055/1) TaxID=556484 RepID=B7GAS1_PHATC|nr:D-glucono-1,5-lactone lactonohydrolase [Phaeodactylum tricornutum CCAP 1055/1]EEC44303.1 D-glucono-1,5-lactone lactonohydrolase [Phaeodactylum tricornutum CCAP 1055/1]|eukprot:XP_002184125.1 D-glucono-1,5-lactone lactonohydrolase [Phaeodactylum tricornutum CCAP 1055/1]